MERKKIDLEAKRAAWAAWSRARRQRLKQEGRCVKCGEPSDGKACCPKCRKLRKNAGGKRKTKSNVSFTTPIDFCPWCGDADVEVKPFVACVECQICGVRGPSVVANRTKISIAKCEEAIRLWNAMPRRSSETKNPT